MTPPVARLAALGRALLPPRRRPVAIVDAEGADDLLAYVREGSTTIVDLRRGHLNAWVLARTLLRGRRSMLDYAAAYLRTVKPSVVLTMIDTTPLFYRLKARWPSATYISVQNGWRAHEFVRDLRAEGGEPLVADRVLCFGEAAAGLYRDHCPLALKLRTKLGLSTTVWPGCTMPPSGFQCGVPKCARSRSRRTNNWRRSR